MKYFRYLPVVFLSMWSLNTWSNPPKPNIYDEGNLWELTAYFDNTRDHLVAVSHRICFSPYSVSGTHIQGRWYSTTFSGWDGRYSQEGDHVFLIGDYGSDTGHDSMEIEIVSQSPENFAVGHWREWMEDGSYGMPLGYTNVQFKRVGSCTLDSSSPLRVAPRLLENGDTASYPAQTGQVPLAPVN